MTVRIVWQGKIRAILCPHCHTAHQVSAQRDNIMLRCSRCNKSFSYLKLNIKLRPLEKDMNWYRKDARGEQNV